MISLSTTATVRRTPPWLADKPDAPAYLLRAGNVIEREMLEAELAGEYGAGRVFDFELAEAFRQGIATLLADDPGKDELLALAAAEGAGEELAAAGRQTLADAREALTQHWPEYRALTVQAERRRQVVPTLALRRFCAGWENVVGADGAPLDFARGPDGLVTMDALKALPPAEMRMAGIEAYGLLYGNGERGNSSGPSSSGKGPKTSRSDGKSKAGGRSKGSDTPKIRA